MRKIPAALALTALALAVPAALAQVSGTVSVTGYSTSVTGDNPWRLFEYRDLDDGFTAGVNLRMQSDAWWHRLFAENLGRDDQFVELRGGRYGLFKYGLYGDDVVHNLTFGAITPFSGAGTNNLTFAGTPSATVPSVNIATWNKFDYGIKHRNVGGYTEIQPGVDSPFYVRFSSNRKRTDGIRPVGGTGGSPGGPAYELQAPVDWTTTDFTGEAGYSSRTLHLSVSALYSKFEDHNDFLNWRHPLVVTGFPTERTTISSDNDMFRIGANAMFKRLPMSSSLALRATYSKLETDMPVETGWLAISGTTGNLRLSNPSSTHFEGEVVSKSMSAALNSNLATRLDSKIYWNWYERENNSHHIVFTPGGPGSGGGCDFTAAGVALPTCTTEFLHFTKNNLGADLQYRVNRENKVTLGLDYTDIERERIDYDQTKEKKVTLEWKSGALGFVDTRVKYQHLDRDSRFLLGSRADPFVRDVHRFDVAPLERDLFKVSFDASPMPLLDLGAEVIWKRNDYKDTILGRTSDKREELYLSASYGDPEAWRVTAFFDYERTHYDSTHWVGATTTYPNPNAAGTAYMWTGKVHDKNNLIGLAADWLPMERLKVMASFTWQKTDGGVDFISQNNLGNPLPIDAYDSFRKKALNVRATYGVHKSLDLTLGAAYEKFDFSDVQLDGYINALRTGTTQNFFSGAYAFPSYKATIVYGTVTYRF
jgi:MtrB/PioB family decaheme-associated outer membrane protein